MKTLRPLASNHVMRPDISAVGIVGFQQRGARNLWSNCNVMLVAHPSLFFRDGLSLLDVVQSSLNLFSYLISCGGEIGFLQMT